VARRFTTHPSLLLLSVLLAGCPPGETNVGDAGPSDDAQAIDGGATRDAGECVTNDDCDDDLGAPLWFADDDQPAAADISACACGAPSA
jgi:hypothetical protein